MTRSRPKSSRRRDGQLSEELRRTFDQRPGARSNEQSWSRRRWVDVRRTRESRARKTLHEYDCRLGQQIGTGSLGIESRAGFGELHARERELVIALQRRVDLALDALAHGQRFKLRFLSTLVGCDGILGRSGPSALRDRACDGPVGQDDSAIAQALLIDLRLAFFAFLRNGPSGGRAKSCRHHHGRGGVSDARGVGHPTLYRRGTAKFHAPVRPTKQQDE